MKWPPRGPLQISGRTTLLFSVGGYAPVRSFRICFPHWNGSSLKTQLFLAAPLHPDHGLAHIRCAITIPWVNEYIVTYSNQIDKHQQQLHSWNKRTGSEWWRLCKTWISIRKIVFFHFLLFFLWFFQCLKNSI